MQTFENDTNCVKTTMKSYRYVSISYWHRHKTCSKYPPLTCILAGRCVCHSLTARGVLYLTVGQHTYIWACDTVWFLEQESSRFISPDQTAPTLTQWTTLWNW